MLNYRIKFEYLDRRYLRPLHSGIYILEVEKELSRQELIAKWEQAIREGKTFTLDAPNQLQLRLRNDKDCYIAKIMSVEFIKAVETW